MSRSARSREDEASTATLVLEGLVLSAQAVFRNPALVGGTTAFLIMCSYVSANALWYQPHFHDGAFFSTRGAIENEAAAPKRQAPPPEPKPEPELSREPVNSIPAPETVTAPPEPVETPVADDAPEGDPTVHHVQSILKELGLYSGTVDGLTGPQTREAIVNYRKIVGLEESEAIDDPLLKQLGMSPKIPLPSPAPDSRDAGPKEAAPQETASPQAETQIAAADPEQMERTKRVQAGLRAFGNEGIAIDGVAGADTEAAIREFQSLFGLEVTGKVDETLHAKMRDVGLTN